MKRIISGSISVLLAAVLIIGTFTTGCRKQEEPASTTAPPTAITETTAAVQPETATEPVTETARPPETEPETATEEGISVQKDGTYTGKEEVAAYINEFGKLPSNFITKDEAKKLGWVSNKGNLWDVAPGKSIGGDRFGNYEGNLPKKKGRNYYECDIGYEGGYRGSERIIYSDDGLIYYTDDHYNTFELLYGEE